MGYDNGFADRRKCRRYTVKEGAYTINTAKTGLIVDISMDGLSFRYIDRKYWPTPLTPELDIILGDHDFFLSRIPYEIVTDQITTSDIPDSTFIVKRCGIKFGDLSILQQIKLKSFIEYNTIETYPEIMEVAL